MNHFFVECTLYPFTITTFFGCLCSDSDTKIVRISTSNPKCSSAGPYYK